MYGKQMFPTHGLGPKQMGATAPRAARGCSQGQAVHVLGSPVNVLSAVPATAHCRCCTGWILGLKSLLG